MEAYSPQEAKNMPSVQQTIGQVGCLMIPVLFADSRRAASNTIWIEPFELNEYCETVDFPTQTQQK